MAGDSVLELRQYTLRSGQRETLISLFEQEFMTPLDEAGAFVRATFRDLDDPDRFVWIRGFSDMASRKRALDAFYDGAVWQSRKMAANATMVDSDNVLLLRPAGIERVAAQVAPRASGPVGIYSVVIYYLNGTDGTAFGEFYRTSIRPRLAALGVVPTMELESNMAANNFPRLPVRERDEVFLWIARWSGARELKSFLDHWSALSGWRDSAPESVLPALMRKPELLRLAPTARSAWR